MAYKSFFLLVLFMLASLLSASIPNEADSKGGAGFWQPLNPNDPEVVEIANFAVKEHNKEAKTALQFKHVVEAWKRVVPGSLTEYYQLLITATDNSTANAKIYHARLASGPIDKSLRLIFFKP